MKVGSQIDVYYQGKTTKASVRDLEVFKRVSTELLAGDRGGVFAKLKQDIQPKRGAVAFQKHPGIVLSKKWKGGQSCVKSSDFQGEICPFL